MNIKLSMNEYTISVYHFYNKSFIYLFIFSVSCISYYEEMLSRSRLFFKGQEFVVQNLA